MKIAMIAALAGLAALTLNASAATLGIGDPAPQIKASAWVKGSPVEKLDAGKTYVVEFWATWCGPCRVSIPHLTEMAHKFKDKVTFVGMDVFERGDAEAVTTLVKKFVDDMGDKMDYNVAMDAKDKFMAEQWMNAAGQNGIPCAFVVEKTGKIAWIGHPMGGLEKALEDITAGKWDPEKAKKRADAQKQVEEFFQAAMKGEDAEQLAKKGKELEALDKELGGIMPEEKFDAQKVIKQARFQSAAIAYQKAVLAGKDADETDKLEAAAKAVAPEDFDFEGFKTRLSQAQGGSKAQQLFTKYMAAVGADSDKEKAAALAKQLGQLKITEPALLNDFAWTLLTDEKVKDRDLALATKFAKAALDASGGKDAAILDTYARAMADSGKRAEAVEYQKKAVEACQDDTQKVELQATLKKYEAAVTK